MFKKSIFFNLLQLYDFHSSTYITVLRKTNFPLLTVSFPQYFCSFFSHISTQFSDSYWQSDINFTLEVSP